MLNFGAFLSFMGVNAAVINDCCRRRNKWSLGVIFPLLGFLFCLAIWLQLTAGSQSGRGYLVYRRRHLPYYPH
jgi:hypothetical protein